MSPFSRIPLQAEALACCVLLALAFCALWLSSCRTVKPEPSKPINYPTVPKPFRKI